MTRQQHLKTSRVMEVDCPTACPNETQLLKQCITNYNTTPQPQAPQSNDNQSAPPPPAHEGNANPKAPLGLSSCIPFIQAWKDCCETAKYKAGQREGDALNQRVPEKKG
jgi:hypothetical protein